MIQLLETLNRFVWGVPALVMILWIGIALTIRTRFAQFSLFPKAIRSFFAQFKKRDVSQKEISPYQALCTALAATVGTGNLAGVAGAIAIGGPGAVFWMWICALLGMVTKFSEAVLSVRYRQKNPSGETVGGPMYMIQNGLGNEWKWLAGIYCFFGVVASFGVGNATQINAVVSGINSAITAFGGEETFICNLFMGILLAVCILFILIGGAKRIGTIAEKLVPFAAAIYLLMGFVVLIGRIQQIPSAFALIIQGAFSSRAVTGGVIGSAFTALRIGASRGVFTNEAGMGTAAIAHGSAQVIHPVEQGLMGIMEVFWDTIVICTMTALVILCSGVPIPYGTDPGVDLTIQAFSAIFGDWVCVLIALFLCLFAIATVLGWGLYGARCAQFLFGDSAWKWFVYIQAGTVIFGAVMGTSTVWMLSEIVNGLMAIPNLAALALLTPELIRLINDYKSRIRLHD